MSLIRPLLARQTDNPSGDGGDTDSKRTWGITVGVIVAFIVVVVVLGLLAFKLKKRKIEKHRRLNSSSSSDNEAQSAAPTRRASQAGSNHRVSLFNPNRLSVRSIRSIISLPAYKETPDDAEEIIARAGDRAGLDFIVEGAETAEEVEAHRQEEMSAIYRVQQTRRRELEERAERRRARRAALDAQDYREVARLDRAAAEARRRERNGSSASLALGDVAESQEPSSADLIAELQEIRTRQRRVSEVTYGDLGTARHDGSRLRGQSVESDLHPLLESSASIARVSTESRNRSRASSVASQSRPQTRNRERSRSRASRNGAGDDTNELSARLSNEGIPHEPPSYDDDLSVHAGSAPRYEDVIVHTPGDSPELPSEGQSSPTQLTPTSSPGGGQRDGEEETRKKDKDDDSQKSPPVSDSNRADGSAGSPASALPSRLQTRNLMTTPPAIEVVSATPVQSTPNTPTNSPFSNRKRE